MSRLLAHPIAALRFPILVVFFHYFLSTGKSLSVVTIRSDIDTGWERKINNLQYSLELNCNLQMQLQMSLLESNRMLKSIRIPLDDWTCFSYAWNGENEKKIKNVSTVVSIPCCIIICPSSASVSQIKLLAHPGSVYCSFQMDLFPPNLVTSPFFPPIWSPANSYSLARAYICFHWDTWTQPTTSSWTTSQEEESGIYPLSVKAIHTFV